MILILRANHNTFECEIKSGKEFIFREEHASDYPINNTTINVKYIEIHTNIIHLIITYPLI